MSTETTNGNKTASPSINNNNNTPTSSSSESSPGGASLAFNERNFSAKLDAVAPTQDSIQSLGLWILHHKFHHEAICRIWLDKLTESSPSSKQKLALFYLANEVIQNCRRKNARIFQESFKKILPRAIEIVGRSESIVKNVERVLDVWLEREVYDRDFINKLISKLQEEKSKILNSPDQATTEALKSSKPPPNHHHHHNTSPKTSTTSNNHKHQSEKVAPSHHHQEKIDSSSIEEIIAEFQVKKLCESLLDFNETIKETNAKKSQVDSTRIVDISSDHVKQYRDKTQCGKFKAEFENSCIKLEELLVKLEAQAKQRIELVRLMEKSEIFYEAQFNDAKTVNNAYRVFGSKVHTMKKKLDEYVLEKFDNKEISDMEMSDEESTSTTVNNNHTSASQKPTMPPRPSQNGGGGGGSIKTHLDPRQSRKASSNMNDSRSKQTSSSSNSISQQKTSPSGGQKRKNEAEDESSTSMGKNSRTSKDDPFDFLSKLINKSASMQPSNIPSSGSGGVEATTNPNLSFLVSSLQKFVNSGSSSIGNSSTGNTALQQQASLEYNPANVGGGSYYDDPYMLMNAGVPPPPPPGSAPAYYPGNHAASSQPLSIAAAPFHHPFYHPLASPGATQPQPPHQLMEIDTHSYAAATAQLASFASGPNSPSAPNPAATNQISPLMALKADEFVTMPQSIDPQSPHHPRHFSHHHQPHFNKHTPEQFEVYDYEYDPAQTSYPNSPFQPQQQHQQQRFEKKRFYGGSGGAGGGGGGQNRRNSYHTNFDFDQNTANSSGYQPYNRFQRVNSYQETNNSPRPNTNNRPINPKSPAGFGQQKNGTADFNNSPSSNRFPNNNNRYA